MPLLWLQRWYYLHALLKLDLNALMLDADVVLFRDPYGTRLGRGASHAQRHTTHPAPLPPLQVRALHRGQPHARAVGL